MARLVKGIIGQWERLDGSQLLLIWTDSGSFVMRYSRSGGKGTYKPVSLPAAVAEAKTNSPQEVLRIVSDAAANSDWLTPQAAAEARALEVGWGELS